MEAVIRLKHSEYTFNGKKLDSYKGVTKSGKFIDVKFTKECNASQKEFPCLKGDCIIITEDYSIDKNRLYPCVWVSTLNAVKPWEKIKDTFTI